ncbi:MAG TPA: ImmA/IrrE family metallo-endopeptidase [Gemmatimonadaceae bacterium]|nr:ImmA/IrrE family metallo-endopeptidase [Gemmatimonadaceae bacterium]
MAFYLSRPPARGHRGQDFRTLPVERAPAEEALLDALIRDVLARQALLREGLEEEDDPPLRTYVDSLRINTPIPAAVRALQEALGSPLRLYREAGNPESAFRILRERAEALGIYVLLVGNLGSHHSALSLEAFRGFAAADPIAPFVVLNDQDSRGAWSFSLLHELTHLWLGQTGVSGGAPESRVERYCNEVAAEFLLPRTELLAVYPPGLEDETEVRQWVDEFSRTVNLSRTMVAFRLLAAQLVTRDQWLALRDHYREEWIASRDRRRELARERESGPSYYVVKRQRLGSALMNAAARLHQTGALTTVKASQILAVKPTQLGALLTGQDPSLRRRAPE